MKKYAQLSILFISGYIEASNLGLIGGIDTTTGSAYAAQISSSGAVIPLNLPEPIGVNGTIFSTPINSSFVGLIGGNDFITFNPYAALISSSGTVTSLNLPGIVGGSIGSTAINNSSVGLIVGGATSGAPYAAQVSSSGVVIQLPLTGISNGIIFSAAINNSSVGLIGGMDSTGPAYVAQVSPSGVVTSLALAGPIAISGDIGTVAINNSSVGLIGGMESGGLAYAARVSPSGVVTQLSLTGLIASNSAIISTAINDSSVGLIVGTTDIIGTGPAYAAQVSPSGVVTALNLTGDIATQGIILSTAISSSSFGLIGGGATSGAAYAAQVSSAGILNPLSLGITNGVINDVAINDFNQGLIGGQNGIAAYAALVSPTGQVIPLNLGLSNGFINSVALLSQIPTLGLSGNNLTFASYINDNAPYDAFYFVPAFFDGTLAQALESAAPTRNAFSLFTADNNLFYLDTFLSNHSRNSRHIRRQAASQTGQSVTVLDIPSEELLVWSSRKIDQPPKPKERPFEIWGTLLGALAYQKKQHQTPAFNPITGGIILGFDGKTSRHTRVGTGAAYTYTYIHEKQDAGHSRINQEYLFLYTFWNNTRWYVDTALWGGLFQIDNIRKIHMTAFKFQSTSHPKGWQLAPHLEFGYDFNSQTRRFTTEPFVMFDWVSNWQGHFKEKGSGPFNAGQKRQYSSFLRSETGARFYETLRYDNWNFIMQEKISYVNKKPFKVGRVHAFLVGAPGSFTVETLTTTQNLAVAQLEFIFQPHNRSYPSTTILYQGEFGSMYQAHIASLDLIWNF